ncbi:MAG TPA: DNA repair exonuclease [Planococcus sp. (in: firmicutes)]|nr:DNA repair exonuclease [Planococcus sp. (in: firmicutes)]
MKGIRFIHAADLHLGSPFTGLKGLQKEQWQKLKDSTLEAFDRLISYALEQQPDFVLIAGDIYDGEDRSLRAQHRFQQGMERLAKAGIPVILCHGNHDHLSGNWTRFELPENVHSFGAAVSQIRLNIRGAEVVVTGFSYGERHIKESMIKAYPAANGRETFHIGMLHGSLEGEKAHAVYAPFTKLQLLEKNYDYWALGHIHLRQQLHDEPPIVYPGNIQGRHRGEAGAKGFYDVQLTKTSAQLTFVQSSVLQFDEIIVDCNGVMHMNELLDACVSGAEDFAEHFGPGAVKLKFINLDAEARDLIHGIAEEELLEAVRESLETLDAFMLVLGISTEEESADVELSPLAEEILSMMDSWQLQDWKEVLKDLYRHPKGSRYLEPLGETAAVDIKAAAAEKIRRGIGIGG